MMGLEDIIIGISTPFAKGAISIIRLSGNGCINLVNQAFKGKDLNKAKSHTINYGHIINKETNELLDEVLVSIFKAPKTYTKEDVVEINCHGGLFVTNLIYEYLIILGARPAEPGEFTKRAFLNGRIDLTKAEAVMDIINAENNNSIKMANQGINGKIYQEVKKYRTKLLDIIASICVNIDYPEYDDVEEMTNKVIKPKIIELIIEMKELQKNSQGALFLKEGINTAIIGKPNVGKSTLLNALAKENKAIVTNIPGTTRDAIEVKVNMKNITLNLIDTAGIRKTNNIVEKIGVEKSFEKMNEAYLILLILDGSSKLTNEEKELINEIKTKPHLIIVNKNDIKIEKSYKELDNVIYISAQNVNDIDKLEQAIINIVLKDIELRNDIIMLSNARQIEKLNVAIKALEEALKMIEQNIYIDMVDIYLRDAYSSLGEITGDTSTDSLINELFSKFCLGK